MNRKDFGKLIRALREEHRDEDDRRCWSRKKFADKVNAAAGIECFVTRDIISKIEYGERKYLDEQTLLALADALQLTSGERKEFFLAASSVDSKNFARPDYDPGKVLSQLIDGMEEVYLPAYILDSFCDVVACNEAVVKLLDLENAKLGLGEATTEEFGFNMLRFVFSEKAVKFYGSLMKFRDWHNYACQNIMIFRTYSLRYRATRYFQDLLEKLNNSKEYIEFIKYWQTVHDEFWQEGYEGKNHFVDNEYIRLESKRWGALVYFSTSITAVTAAGELYFCVYNPGDARTAKTFMDIVEQSGPNIHRLAPWPKEELWPKEKAGHKPPPRTS